MKPVLIYYKENAFSQSTDFHNIRMATSGRNIDEKFYLTFQELASFKEAPAIFIMNTLSDNALELQGPQMAHYLRIMTRGKDIGALPLFLIGTEDAVELLHLSDYASILQTPSVELLPYSKERVKDVIGHLQEYPSLESYESYLKKASIPQPDNHPSHHSVTSEWSLYRWSECLGIKSPLHLYIEQNLYYRYILSQHPETGPRTPITLPTLPLTTGKKRILLIDDEAEKGWKKLYEKLFSSYRDIEINTLEGFDYASGTETELLQKTEETIKKDAFSPYHLVLLDIRLLHSDFKKDTDFSSFKVIELLRRLNKGIQIILVTSSNKVWNLQHTLSNDVFDYITKESVFEEHCSEKKIERLLRQSLAAIDQSNFLQQVAKNEQTILKRLKEKEAEEASDVRRKMWMNIKEQMEIAWVMLTHARFDKRYLRYAYLSYYQILELFVDTTPGMYLKINGRKEICCSNAKGEEINCSEKLRMKYDTTRKGHLIQITRHEKGEKELESGSYAKIGAWMFARTDNRDFVTWMQLNATRNNNTHGGSSSTLRELEKQVQKIMSLIIDFVNNA